jgi:gliding motility-associated-like protein
VKVKDNNGCEAIDSIHVVVKCDAIYFPTAFSPNNGDDINNTFGPAPLSALSGISQFHLMVYNRFGQVVFESKNPYNKWNGAVNGLFTNGVYIWKANYTIANRKTLAQSGTLLLFR